MAFTLVSTFIVTPRPAVLIALSNAARFGIILAPREFMARQHRGVSVNLGRVGCIVW